MVFKLSLLYCLFILSAMSSCTTRFKALVIHPDCTNKSPRPLVPGIPLTERQRLRDNHLSMPLGFLTCHWEYDPVTDDHHFKLSFEPRCICLYLGFNPHSLVSFIKNQFNQQVKSNVWSTLSKAHVRAIKFNSLKPTFEHFTSRSRFPSLTSSFL